MKNCNTVATPADPSQKLSKQDCPKTDSEEAKEMKNIPYRALVGSLMHAMVGTRPDIAFAVSQVARFMHNPGPKHWTAAKRILRYLKKTKDMKIAFQKNAQNVTSLHAYADADWASNPDDRKSITGYIFMSRNAPLSWCSRRQPTIALSTAEAEYMSACAAAQEAVWLRKIFKDPPTIEIFDDNQAAIALTQSPCNHTRSKHIDTRFHYLRERVLAKDVKLTYIPSSENIADIFTKPLPRPLFEKFRAMFMSGTPTQDE